MRRFQITLFQIILLLLAGISATATHLKGGFIRIEHSSGLTYKITVTVFTNTANSNVLFGGDDDFLDFGDGTKMTVAEQPNVFVGPTFTIAEFSVLHTYAGASSFVVSYSEPNRNEGIVNMDLSVNTRFYIESGFTIDPVLGNYSSPVLNAWPIFEAVAGSVYNGTVSAYDPNDHTLSYYVTFPKRDTQHGTVNYRLPEGFSVNRFNGLITWDTMSEGATTNGEYLFNVKIVQGVSGYMVVDFQINVSEAPNEPMLADNIETDDNNRLYIEAGNQKTLKVFYEDPASPFDSVFLTAYSEISDFVSMTTYDSVIDGHKIKAGVISIDHDASMTRFNPYVITVRGTSGLPGSQKRFSKDISYLFYTQDVDLADLIVATNDDNAEKFGFYPNPFADFVTFYAPANQEARVILRNLNNQIVYDQVIKEGEKIQFNNDVAPKLVYQIFTATKIHSGKIMKK